jgi:hypothetical protein
LSANIALDLTHQCLSAGKDDDAMEIRKNLIRNRHDDKEFVEKTRQIFSDASKADVGNSFIDKTKSEIIELNNNGVRLVKEGKLEESIELFMKAARGMPGNVVVNLNAAHSILMQMQKSGR